MNTIRQMVLWGLGRRQTYRVRGDSMRPTLKAGDLVLVDPTAYERQPPRIGDLVVARHPWRRNIELIKRIKGRTRDGEYLLKSDDPTRGTDSESMGAVPANHLRGRVELCLPRR